MDSKIPYDSKKRLRILTGEGHHDYEELKADTDYEYPVSAYTASLKDTVLHRIRWHWHHDSEIALVVDGSADFHVSDNTFTIPKGQGIVINHSILHSVSITEGFANAIISFVIFNTSFLFGKGELSLYERYVSPVMDNEREPCHILTGETPGDREILSFVPKIVTLNVERKPLYELYTKEMLLHMLILTLEYLRRRNRGFERELNSERSKKKSLDDARTKDAISYIENHYGEAITLDDIAESIHVSKSECCRCIKRSMGMTPFEYLLRYRIMVAAGQLRTQEGKISISELAASVGFNSSSYFNKLFRKYIGETPTKYRALHMQNADIPARKSEEQ